MHPDDYVERIATILLGNTLSTKLYVKHASVTKNTCSSSCKDCDETGHFLPWSAYPSSNNPQQGAVCKLGGCYEYCPSNSVMIPCEWQLWDPYEHVTVICRPSKLPTSAGDGLFALRDISSKTVISYYNGIRVLQGEPYSTNSCDYQIYVDWNNIDDSPFMDIPKECVDLFNYSASLAHKSNHSFRPNCQFVPAHHPRYIISY